jgi:hypothetical protein
MKVDDVARFLPALLVATAVTASLVACGVKAPPRPPLKEPPPATERAARSAAP